MRILLVAFALLLSAVAFAPSASAVASPICPLGSPDYCVSVSGTEVCATYHLGDLEGPYTTCVQTGHVDVGQLPGECTASNDHYCYSVQGRRVCVTYDLGDLEGPYTTCVGK